MAEKVTRDILESYLFCQYKAHLKLRGELGVTSDYEEMLTASRTELKQRSVSIALRQVPLEFSVALFQ